MNTRDWAQRHRQAAADLSPSAVRRLTRQWMGRARSVKQQHSYHAAKKAVRECSPSPDESRALHALFASEAETIFYICRDAARSVTGPLGVEDVLQDAWPLFLRALLAWQPGQRTLRLHLRRTFRDKVRDHVATADESPAPDPDHRAPQTGPTHSDGAIELARVYDALAEAGRLPDAAETLWREHRPERVV
jgi:hypothetical protein